jgi:phospholipase C
LVNVLGYLRNENDVLPWRTAAKHVKDMVDIIQYRPSFYAVSVFIITFYQNLVFIY